LYCYGELPLLVVDHINRVKTDNRLINLRLASGSQNSHNIDAHARSKSGIKGVWWDKRREQWVAEIAINNNRLFLGRFHSFNEAKAAYMAASIAHAKEFSIFSETERNDVEETVSVSMSMEEAARRWLAKKSLCAIEWNTLEQLCDVYRKNGSKTLVFDASGPTYTLREKRQEDAVLLGDRDRSV
jgi:hypothetical protein